MRIYLATIPQMVLTVPQAGVPTTHPMRLLFSYVIFRRQNVGDYVEVLRRMGYEVDLFVDSGAFTAYSSGTAVDPLEYCEWVRKWERYITIAAAPDVIGDPDATQVQAEKMRACGLSVPVLPTVHVGEDPKLLDYWCSKTDYLALGGMVPYLKRPRRPLLAKWCAKTFERIPSSVKIHGFGMTLPSLVRAFPWYSVDSSYWSNYVYRGVASLIDRRTVRMVRVDRSVPKSVLRLAPLLADYQLRPETFKTFDGPAIGRATMESWRRFEDWLNRRGEHDGDANVPAGDGGSRQVAARRVQPARDVGG